MSHIETEKKKLHSRPSSHGVHVDFWSHLLSDQHDKQQMSIPEMEANATFFLFAGSERLRLRSLEPYTTFARIRTSW